MVHSEIIARVPGMWVNCVGDCPAAAVVLLDSRHVSCHM